jgi:DNA-binding CsgD family transcriptional regulator
MSRGGVENALVNAHGAPLRPIERRVRRLTMEGTSTDEIARRFRRTPETIARLRDMSELRRGDGAASVQGDVLRPVERRVLRWLADGASHEDIGGKLCRSGDFVRRVESFAQHKLGTDGTLPSG